MTRYCPSHSNLAQRWQPFSRLTVSSIPVRFKSGRNWLSRSPGGVEAAKQILPTPTPLATQVKGLAFYETSVGSLRCLGEVVNPSNRALENVQVRVVLKDARVWSWRKGGPLPRSM